MRVFISWSGERSRVVGQALRDWLPLVLHYVQPWLSAADIDAGQRWATEVGQQLNDSTFGVLCLTRDNLQSPWILFEAGALAKSVAAGAVVPYLLDLEFSDITGPLAQFQAKKADEHSTLELVTAINNRAGQPIPSDRLEELFELTWPRLAKAFAHVPKAGHKHNPNDRSATFWKNWCRLCEPSRDRRALSKQLRWPLMRPCLNRIGTRSQGSIAASKEDQCYQGRQGSYRHWPSVIV